MVEVVQEAPALADVSLQRGVRLGGGDEEAELGLIHGRSVLGGEQVHRVLDGDLDRAWGLSDGSRKEAVSAGARAEAGARGNKGGRARGREPVALRGTVGRVARPRTSAKARSGGRARRGEVASVERAPSCSKPKSMATGMSSRPSLSTGSSWIRAMLPPTRDSKATNRRRRARRVIFRSRAWRWRRTQCRDRTRPRGKRPGGSDARHFLRPNAHTRRSKSIGARELRPHSTRVSRRVRPTGHHAEPVRTCPLPLEGGTSARVTTSGSCVCPNRFGANPRQETEDAARPSPHARAERRARERSTRVD